MPSILKIGSYYIYFWANENTEPVHVHVSKSKPVPNATKIWLTKAGGCIVANNNSRIPQHELNSILDILSDQHFYICREWIEMFGKETLKFYC